ncbi:MAG: RHS repeat-associated core domain-containing protein [Terracidiphilus sp.]
MMITATCVIGEMSRAPTYYRARYYNPATGRFLSEDPLGFGGGTVNFYQYAMDNPMGFRDPTGLLNVYTWPATRTGNVGHAAILLDDGTYISFWPGSGPASVPTLQRDQTTEGSTPAITNIEGLDEAAMENWWNQFKKANEWSLGRPNCSTAAAHALDAGGGRKYVPFGQDHHYFWIPQDVAQYANDISFGMSNPSVLQQGIYYLPRMF